LEFRIVIRISLLLENPIRTCTFRPADARPYATIRTGVESNCTTGAENCLWRIYHAGIELLSLFGSAFGCSGASGANRFANTARRARITTTATKPL
jgi:hypothetical protein